MARQPEARQRRPGRRQCRSRCCLVNARLDGARGPGHRARVAEALLELRGVRKRFGERAAVDGVSLQLFAGEIFGLLGPNGAGKTTLLRMAVDLLRPDEGELRLLGEPPGPQALE